MSLFHEFFGDPLKKGDTAKRSRGEDEAQAVEATADGSAFFVAAFVVCRLERFCVSPRKEFV